MSKFLPHATLLKKYSLRKQRSSERTYTWLMCDCVLIISEGLCVFTKCGSPDMPVSNKKVEDLTSLVTSSMEYLSTFHEYVSYLPAAVSYIKLLRALSNLAPEMTSIQVKISKLFALFLITQLHY